jgi:hypothetical protein
MEALAGSSSSVENQKKPKVSDSIEGPSAHDHVAFERRFLERSLIAALTGQGAICEAIDESVVIAFFLQLIEHLHQALPQGLPEITTASKSRRQRASKPRRFHTGHKHLGRQIDSGEWSNADGDMRGKRIRGGRRRMDITPRQIQ